MRCISGVFTNFEHTRAVRSRHWTTDSDIGIDIGIDF